MGSRLDSELWVLPLYTERACLPPATNAEPVMELADVGLVMELFLPGGPIVRLGAAAPIPSSVQGLCTASNRLLGSAVGES